MAEAPIIVETRDIPLPKGGTLTVEMTQAFIDRLRSRFGLLTDEPLDDDHVRMFVWGSFDAAVTKVEQERTKDVAGQLPRVRKPRRRKQDSA